ncbi:hypothetical protein JK359_14645 [Streptomyces actinomycinicus]|uniref:Lipoprotein n=1 Tax=Streptomyces actinomycinicus TaxID=1695166 RepID=A0A937EHJ3_9ACTN|nr:hypothetical protein [Streptomyces actinomycinicus]MBL1083212.1 hypothetical protein [Streptomyces actinomycinicus]
MNPRHMAVAALALLALSGCAVEQGSEEAGPKPHSSPADGARRAVDAYLSALNTRSATGLIRTGGVQDAPWSRREAAKILADKGGRGWRVSSLEIDRDMGPDTGSARLSAEDEAGRFMKDTFTVTRDNGRWHLVLFTGQPGRPDRTPASTAAPTTS